MENKIQKIKDYLLQIDKYKIEDEVNKEKRIILNESVIFEDIEKNDLILLKHLENSEFKDLFFTKINDFYVFNQLNLIKILKMNEHMKGSYTSYSNKIGMFISEDEKITLDFPYKDCILAGNMDKEDEKNNIEKMYNEILEKDKIDKLFEPKILCNPIKYSFSKKLSENDKLDNHKNIQVDQNVNKIKFETITNENGEEKQILKDNLLIKGNNLLGLYSLATKMSGMIDVIYIDPPYYFNYKKTSDSFAYNSNFKLSTWLTFMKNRLEIARELLSDTGVIFISMNEDGNSHLKLLCDDIFEIDNFISNICWNKQNAQNDAEYFQENKENIIIYKKNKKINLKNEVETEEKIIKIDGSFYIKKGGIIVGSQNGDLNKSNNSGYSIYWNEKTNEIIPKMDYDKEIAKFSNNYEEIYEKEDENLIKKGFVCIRPPKKNGKIKAWTWGFTKMLNQKNEILISKLKDNYSVIKIEKIKDISKIKNNIIKIKKLLPSKNILNFSSSNGTKKLNLLFGKKIFENSKPIELIEHLLKLFNNKSITILDFFAGSGTTAQAVLSLNKKDNGNRKFILLEQMDYAQNITAERIRRSMIKEEYEDSFIYLELKKDTIKNELISSNYIKEVEQIIEDNFDKGYFQYLNNKEELISVIKDIQIANSKLNEEEILKFIKKEIIEKYFDFNMEYHSINDLELHKKDLKENEILLNENFYNLGK